MVIPYFEQDGIELSADYCELARKRLSVGIKGVIAMNAGQQAISLDGAGSI